MFFKQSNTNNIQSCGSSKKDHLTSFDVKYYETSKII